ncbi:hypothetical protein SI65_06972 [Aspergillus cristatus]|uniref:Uncharacterized protein n=1 Tax=Aspergillus cristatus TaxID=573508 RepID=A0A1E3B8M5_ASPCR|nr:hypothetical protein SI65_06972 [Aspergillus cristatus]
MPITSADATEPQALQDNLDGPRELFEKAQDRPRRVVGAYEWSDGGTIEGTGV